MSFDAAAFRSQLLADVERLRKEALMALDKLVLSTWNGPMHGFPETLYGYMLRIFSYIDLLSGYWRGMDKDQSIRMVDFMEKYSGPNRRAHSVAVQVWRHKLMHTAQPRPLHDPISGKSVRWLLQWYSQHLPRHQHYVFQHTSDMEILNIGCIYLIEDLQRAAQLFLDELLVSPALQQNAEKYEKELDAYQLREL